MKLTVFLLFFGVISLIARPTYSQNTKISLEMKDATIARVLNEIEAISEFYFLYNSKLIDVEKKVDIAVKKEPIKDVLMTILPANVSFVVIDRQIVLTSERLIPEAETALQQKSVTGKISDAATGEPIPGVTVLAKGTIIGTTSGLDGSYSIIVPPGSTTLVISFIGYQTLEIPIGDKTVINATMFEEITALEEVVVIGYGVQKRSDLTGSVSSVTGEKITSSAAPGLDQALQGKAAGVVVMSTSGTPGANSSIRIRGTGSLYSGNDPLFVLDGLPVGSDVVSLINPNDIETIEILKDASSAAIYGSRGANGVILVTTKRGKSGSPIVSFDSYAGIKKTPEKYKMGDAAQYIQIYLLGKKASGALINDLNTDFQSYYSILDGIDYSQDYGLIQKTLYDQIKKDYPAGTNWWDELIHDGVVQSYNISIMGGGESFKYASSISYYDEKGAIKKSGYSRLTFRLNSDYNVTRKLRISTNFTFVNTQELAGNQNSGIISNALQMDPITPVTRSEEKTLLAGGNPDNPLDLFSPAIYTTSILNPAAQLERNMGGYDALRLIGNASLEYSILSGLMLNSNFGFISVNGNRNRFSPQYYIDPADRNDLSQVSRGNNYSNSWNLVNQLTYVKNFGKNSFTGMAAIEASHERYEEFTASAQNTPGNDEAFRFLNLANMNPNVFGSNRESSMISYLTRLNYAYASKYLVTATFRRDGSSKFASGNRWGNFTSFALAYKISEEEFFKNLNIPEINSLKIRGGWGQIGNSNIPSFAYLSQYKLHPAISYAFGPTIPYTGGGISALTIPSYTQGIIPSIIGNPDIKWETQEQLNIGTDIGIFNNQFTLTADYFIRTTKDNLVQKPTPGYVGYPNNPWSNNGQIENRGFEFTTDYRNHIGDLNYSFGGNISFVKNKVISLGDGADIPGGFTRINGNGTITRVGSSIADFIGYKTEGIFQTQGEIDNHIGADGSVLQPNAKPGDFKFANTNNDNALNDNDRIILGSSLPKYSYGFNIELGYRGFELKLLFQGQYGNKILMSEKYYLNTGQGFYNSVEDLPDIAWHGPGTSNTQPRIISTDLNLNFRMSDYYLETGSFTRLKNAQLAYNLPVSICSSMNLNKVTIYLSGENLLTLTRYPGLDPEMHSNTLSEMMGAQLGLSTFGYPQCRTLFAGIKIGF